MDNAKRIEQAWGLLQEELRYSLQSLGSPQITENIIDILGEVSPDLSEQNGKGESLKQQALEILGAIDSDSFQGEVAPLHSVLSNIRLGKQSGENSKVYTYPADPLPESFYQAKVSELYPDPERDSSFPEEIDQNLEKFGQELKKLALLKDTEAKWESLYFLLYKYCSRLPSFRYSSLKDISLFDHLRIFTGLAHNLAAFGGELPAKPFVMVKGDLSGIQKFIYSKIDMSQAGNTQGLSKRLRGRSFYVSLLTEFIAERFVERFELLRSNIIFVGGGQFLMVIPNIEGWENKITEFSKEFNQYLLGKVESRTSLVIGATLCGKDLYQNSSRYMKAVNDDLNEQKYLKHKGYLEYIFDPNRQTPYKPDADPEKKVPKAFNEDIGIGKKLPYANVLIELRTKEKIKNAHDEELKWAASYHDYHTYYFLPKSSRNAWDGYSLIEILSHYEKEVEIASVKVYQINGTQLFDLVEVLKNAFPQIAFSFGFKFIGTYAPKDEDNHVLEFGAIAELNSLPNLFPEERTYAFHDQQEGKLNYPLLAVMRLDIDDLGTLFAFGMGENTPFARTATLSRELEIFFSGYMNKLAEDYRLYVTYSGGDDAFVVGSWINVLHFAQKLKQDFEVFTCQNPEISFSAGIYLCDEHFPVAKFADRAEEAVDEAKDFTLRKKLIEKHGQESKQEVITHRKNALSVFDHTLSWDQYRSMLVFAEKLLSKVPKEGSKEQQGKFARSLVHRVYRLIRGSLSQGGHLLTNRLYRNSMQLHYLFAKQGYTQRVLEKNDLQTEVPNMIIKAFIDHGDSGDIKSSMLQNYQIPMRYVLMKTRKNRS